MGDAMNNSKSNPGTAQGTPARHRLYAGVFAALVVIGATAPAYAQRNDAPHAYSIQAGSLGDALNQLASQSKLQIIYSPELVKGKTAAAVNGQHTWREALQRLLNGTGLTWGLVNDTTVVVKQDEATPKPVEQPKPKPRPTSSVKEEEATNMPTIFVTGARSLNMDITRTEDDPQPYVVFDREQIERSGATSLEQFLQQRLTMNTNTANAGAGTGITGIATSQINLRGLGAAQTLILVDGHRVSSPAFSGASQGALSQADITGLPLGAIERIEVLPTTASGIYGGSATGGVINIILRRDYTGGEVRITYDNTFDTDTASRKVDLTFGHSFNQGKTNLMVTANYAEANDLLVGDRDFAQRGREAIWRNNPGFFLGPTGQPPLGATPNIASADGSNLVLDDGTPLNAAFTSVPEGYAGVGSDGSAGLIANAGTYNWELAQTAQSGGSRQALYTQPRIRSGAMVLRHQVSDGLQVFADLSSSQSVSQFPANFFSSDYLIPASSPTNPFVQDIRISVPLRSDATELSTTIEHHRALAGLVWQLPGNWLLGGDATWDRTSITNNFPNELRSTFTDTVTAGTIDVLRDIRTFPIDLAPYLGQGAFTSPFRSTMTDFNVRASGPVGQSPGGSLMLSTSAAHREETVADAFWSFPASSLFIFYPERSQTVSSAYAELRVPLFSKKNARPGLRELELQLAVRRDDYTSRSGMQLTLSGEIPSPLPEPARSRNGFVSTDPTVALRWKPWDSLALRASYGTGFIPPGLNQLIPTIFPVSLAVGIDPLRGNTRAGPYTYITGGNADLKPEQSESWSAGLILTPTDLPNWRISLDYTRIEKADNIATHPGFIQGFINDEALFPGRIVRGPNLPGDPPGWAGPITQLDTSLMNLASATLEAWDLQLDVRQETDRFGTFDLFFMGTWQPHYRVRTIDNQPETEFVGIASHNPLKFKANAGATWTRAAWRLGWNVQHFDAYKVSDDAFLIARQGSDGRIPSQTYHDVFIHYDFGLRGRTVFPAWLSGIEVQFGIRNLFDKAPPTDVSNSFGLYSRFGDPRLASYYLTVTARF